MDDWRKTHLTKEVNSKLIGQEIILGGWIRNIRDLGGLKFMDI